MHYTGLAASALLYWRFLEGHDIAPGPVFEEAGLDPALLEDHDARFSESSFCRLTELVVARTGDTSFGINCVRYWHPSMVHALGYAWLASDTLHEALDRLVRFYRIVTDKDVLTLEVLGDDYQVTHAGVHPDVPAVAEEHDSFFAVLTHLCRMSAGESFAPLRVLMKRVEPPDPQAFADYFRAPIHYGANQNAIFFRCDDVDRQLPTANADVARASDQVVVEYLRRHDGANTSMLVRARLTEQLPSGRASQVTVARAMHTSARSLQRRLGEEGTTFRALLAETRRELAMQYMRRSELSISEITYLLGFSEPANFTRAFRRWSGQSPSRYREALRARARPGACGG